jgi:hypothetical protein
MFIKWLIFCCIGPILFAALSTPAYGQAWSGLLSPSRATDWSKAGVQGGIPSASWAQCGSTIAAYGSSGSPGSPSTIQTAINNCTANHYVQLGAGNFYLSGSIYFQGRSNIEIRGMGANSTFIYFYGNTGVGGDNCGGYFGTICFESSDVMYPGQISNTTTWTAGYTQGATQITLSNVCPNVCLTIGNPVILTQQTTPTDAGGVLEVDADTGGHPFVAPGNGGPYSGQGSNSYPGRDQSHVYMVTGCNGSTTAGTACSGSNVAVTIDPPLIEGNWAASLAPEAFWASHPSRNVGVQDVSIDGTNNGCSVGNGYGVFIQNTADAWVQGVRDVNECRTHIGIQMSARVSIRNNYIFLARDSTSTSYGFECWGASDSLWENNITQAIANPYMFNEGCGGNVIAYNYSINDYFSAPGWHLVMAADHAVNDDYNLYEGNVGPGFDGDAVHGTHNFDTVFRNRFSGTDAACWQSGPTNQDYASYLGATWGTCTEGLMAVQIYSDNRFFNVIGNVLGASGATTGYLNTGTAAEQYNYVLNIGVGDNHNGAVVPADPTVLQTVMLWGNCDNVHGFSAANCQFTSTNVPVAGNLASVQQPYANSVPASNTLPKSFYYSSIPSWWPATKPWPSIGPDVTGGNLSGTGGLAYTNPAEDCYSSLTGATSSGTGGPFPFDANTCYGSSVATQPPGAASGLSAAGR